VTLLRSAAEVLSTWRVPDAGVADECCVFARQVLERAYGLPPAHDDLLGLWHVWDIARPWSPVQAALRTGIAVSVTMPPDPPALREGRWHLVQGWRGTPGSGATGHTFLWLHLGARGLCLDASDKRRPEDTCRGLRTWGERTAEFRAGVAVAVLRVPGR
jgi:hypothetical protein